MSVKNSSKDHATSTVAKFIRRKTKLTQRPSGGCLRKNEEMKIAFTSGNSSQSLQLAHTMGSRRSTVIEEVKKRVGSSFNTSRGNRTLGRNLGDQELHWNCSVLFPVTAWDVHFDLSSTEEIRSYIGALKRRKAADSENLLPISFKEGSEVLMNAITDLFRLLR